MESINYYANSNPETYSLIPHYYFQTVPDKTFVSVIGKSDANTCNDWKNKFSFRLPNDRFVVDFKRNHWTFGAEGLVENRMFEDIYEYFVFVFTPDKEDMESLNKMIDMAERCPKKSFSASIVEIMECCLVIICMLFLLRLVMILLAKDANILIQ